MYSRAINNGWKDKISDTLNNIDMKSILLICNTNNKKEYKAQWCWISILAAQNTNWKQIKGVKKYVLNNAGDIDDCCYAARAILILFLLHRQFLYYRLLSMYMFPFLSYHILSNYPNVHFKSSRKTCFFCHYTVQSI